MQKFELFVRKNTYHTCFLFFSCLTTWCITAKKTMRAPSIKATNHPLKIELKKKEIVHRQSLF